jgi:altronate hydrolase
MFGAEHILMQRSASRDVFDKTVAMVNGFKEYYRSSGQPIYENPSPGNKEGGITTLEEKSLGCITKGGSSEIVDVLEYGERVKKDGLSLLSGPGNDIVAITNLAASGAQIILFTTGRGTPLGGIVPTVKIATNHPLYLKKSGWMDFDASSVLSGEDLGDELFEFVLEVAEGKNTKNEINGYREIAIFKDGITL